MLHIFDDDDVNDEDDEERFGDSHLDDGLEDFIIGDEGFTHKFNLKR